MRMPNLSASLLLALLLAWAPCSRADFSAGLAAYERGDGKAALAQWRPQANAGDAEAQYYLGRLYFYEFKDIRRNYRTAARWFRKAAEQGHAAAQYKLGGMYLSGRGVTPDDGEVVKWWRLAALQGHAESQNNLGAMFAQGRGVARAPLVAYALQALALANGNELAAQNLRAKEETMSAADIETARTLAREMEQPGRLAEILRE